MAKILKFKDVNSDVERRMKDFEKMSLKLKADKKSSVGKDSSGLLKSISGLFTDAS
ncbi:hypothetical protein ACQ9BO_00945 [Flavobacterium sp. P21]|uniref:hypothetical protein n=1 Tax=Flavobacterium sp. P21 TaxID=3423948 RepID=UPI003D67F072